MKQKTIIKTNHLKTMNFIKISTKFEKDDEDASNAYFSMNPLIRWIFIKRLKYALSLVPVPYENNSEILDLGMGCGILIPSLAKYGNVYGMDYHNKFLDRSKTLCGNEGVSAILVKGDILNIPFEDNKFDIIFCLSVLEHIKDLDKAVKEIERILKPNGILIVGLPIERLLVNLFFYITTFSKAVKKYHISLYDEIEIVLDSYLILEESKKIPFNLLFDDFCFYEVLRYRKVDK